MVSVPAGGGIEGGEMKKGGKDLGTGLIGTRYEFRREFENRRAIEAVFFERMRSPFYEGEKWAVRWGSSCLSRRGQWELEPLPSSRDDKFYARCRFDSLPKALAAFWKSEAKGRRGKGA